MTTNEILSRLEAVATITSGWKALCPAHDDRAPSLSIATAADGRTLIRCHAGCETVQVVKAMGLRMSDLFFRPKIVVRGICNAAR